MFKLIDGKAHSAAIRGEIHSRVAQFKKATGKEVGLAVVLVGSDPASQVYVRNKIKGCEEVGIKSYAYYLPAEATQSEVEELVCELVANDTIHGILVQLPMPKHLDAEKILKLIPKSKDVDGFCEENIGNLCLNRSCLVACTPNGVMKMLEREGISLRGKNAVVIGRSNIVGKPIAMLLLNADATVTVCHSKTENLKNICRGADILVAAIGRAKFVTADMVKEGAVVVDVGMNRDENGKLCGDVDFENVKEKCSYITPVPGGVGPMTITMLLYNTVTAAERSVEIE
ncbi:MAG: bifunctional methylenetetrahydrofolate dehydrogenase/methenyltetrahydrofolate cyclohydrolase FolD [Clostridiales bacterium]|nr:bifunctional methylenetetrahydrofolate dehydrogenase/methenyltetrahydrofolate cyclohydrolase FolD [Clostridiales bacterium]